MTIERRVPAGVAGIGLDVYWPQLAGLEKRFERYATHVAERFVRSGVEVANLGHQCHGRTPMFYYYPTTFAL